MCHAATHLIDNEIDEAHGPVWFKWTKIAGTFFKIYIVGI